MKRLNLAEIKGAMILFFLVSFLISGCSESSDPAEVMMSDDDLEQAVELSAADETSQSLDDIVDNAYLEVDFNNLFKEEENKLTESQRFFSKCANIDKEITDTGYRVTLDFGDGCITKREDEISGKILMSILKDQDIKTVTIDYSFDNFFINGNKIEGEAHKIKTRENDQGLPQSAVNKEIKIIREDGSETEISSERTRVKIEGSETMFWGDDVIEITGSSVHSNAEGKIREMTIVEPLIRSLACKFIVSGIIEVQSELGTKTIDFGDGSCDSEAMVEKNGESRQIQLRRKGRI